MNRTTALGTADSVNLASANLVAKIHDVELAKKQYDVAAEVFVGAEEHLQGAIAAEVEAHEALRAEMVSRRKSRRA